MPINMMNFIQLVRSQGNPGQFLMGMLEQQSTPFYQNITNLIKNNQMNEVELILRNAMKEQGRDFDKEFNSFKKMLGVK